MNKKIKRETSYICLSCEETEKLAKDLAIKLRPGSILAFFGDLGTGKTTFVRYLSKALAGVAEELVTSPTFQYLNIYSGHVTVYHFDLYRITNEADFIHMGFDEMLHGDGICCIEWAERIESILPAETIRIHINHTQEGGRLVNIQMEASS